MALLVSGIAITPGVATCDNPAIMGQYQIESNTIELCNENISRSNKFDKGAVLRHETIHAIHNNLGLDDGHETIIPIPILVDVSYIFISPDEALAIATHYGDDANQEFEARIVQHLPDEVVALGLLYSKLVKTIT